MPSNFYDHHFPNGPRIILMSSGALSKFADPMMELRCPAEEEEGDGEEKEEEGDASIFTQPRFSSLRGKKEAMSKHNVIMRKTLP